MNRSHDAAIKEYMNGNSDPLVQVLRTILKKFPVLCDFVVLIIQRKIKLKRGPKAGKNEKRDRYLATRLMELKRTKSHWDALQDLADEANLSVSTIARAHRTYNTGPKSRHRS